ncbi:uncharacterized protein [Notothenia coriiceps]|uniref:Mixed lineage kinase domain-containing protein n=1 Tax=Notothenia coriiceps TaxID=8208 RepID=A0A6I9PXH2_9TELE|nr:PREDICTED: uncharacterized protein LOC104963043 [Notothenia coriiceps]
MDAKNVSDKLLRLKDKCAFVFTSIQTRPAACQQLNMAALDPYLGVLDFSLNLCSSIYTRAANVSANKERCQQIAQRVKALEGLILTIKHRGTGQLSPAMDDTLKEICCTLTSAKTLMEKLNRTKMFMRFLKSRRHEEQLSNLDRRLYNHFLVLSEALLIEQGDTLHRICNVNIGDTQPMPPIITLGATPRQGRPSLHADHADCVGPHLAEGALLRRESLNHRRALRRYEAARAPDPRAPCSCSITYHSSEGFLTPTGPRLSMRTNSKNILWDMWADQEEDSPPL